MAIGDPGIYCDVIEGIIEVARPMLEECLARKCSTCSTELGLWRELRLLPEVLCLRLFRLRSDLDLGLLNLGVVLRRSHFVLYLYSYF